MYWSHPLREESYQYPNQYSFGDALIIAPIVSPKSSKTGLGHVKVWVPPERHVDLLTGRVYDGDRELDMYRPLGDVPVLATGGAIVPLDLLLTPDNGCKNPEGYEVLVVVGKDGKYTIIENERDNVQAGDKKNEHVSEIEWNQGDGRLTIKSPLPKGWAVRFVSVLETSQAPSVSVNGTAASKAKVSVEKDGRFPGLVISLSEAVEANSTITIDIGAEPQLGVWDHSRKLEDLITALQINFAMKDNIWSAIQSKQPDVVKMGRLLGLALETEVAGPLVEYLVGDSRKESGVVAHGVNGTNGVKA